jgi:hypothetical protein
MRSTVRYGAVQDRTDPNNHHHNRYLRSPYPLTTTTTAASLTLQTNVSWALKPPFPAWYGGRLWLHSATALNRGLQSQTVETLEKMIYLWSSVSCRSYYGDSV